tara:strand:- start:2189 stop:2407 length:219 start_codon:yes stop_codon:yes gene_type:complete
MITLRIHENNTGTVKFETEEQLEEWIKKPFFEDVEWEYADYEVFHRTFFVERNTDSVNPTIEDISNGVWNNA